jgi:diguanylate cyclase (GGDEF)-like protein
LNKPTKIKEQFMSMYRQLWLAIVTSMLLALCGGLLASLLSARSYLESQLSIKNTDNATALALSLSQGQPDSVTVDLVVASLFDSGHYEYIRVVDPLGKTIAERQAQVSVWDAPVWFVHLLPIHAQAGKAQISNGWKQFGTVTLQSHSRFAYGALWQSAYEMAGALAIAGLVGGYLGALVLGRIRRPLQAVVEQAQAITERRFITMDEPTVPELKKLAVAMNTTVLRLKSMFDEEANRLEKVRQDANYDALTGLVNRVHFMARLGQMLESEDSVGGTLILIRLADLAGINRRMGRAAADEYLQKIANTLQKNAVPASQCVVARLNGADFSILCASQSDMGQAMVSSILSQLQQDAEPFVETDAAVWMGIGRFTRGHDMQGLLAAVDLALAGAEARGVSALHEARLDVAEEMPHTAEQWAHLIENALEKHWVRLVSFPVVNVRNQVLHWECPLRLMLSEKSEWLPAGRFLPVAERLKLTSKLDLVAINLGLQMLRKDSSVPGLAINLSASSLEDADFQRRLLELIDTSSEHASRLWLEVAEGSALKHLESFRQLCKALIVRGCHVGLEHFGHHFSQIGVWHDMGLNYLKVDASFIRGVEANAGNATFLKGLCTISHNIGLQVLAEGVATSAEQSMVLSLGFDGATGPFIREELPIA